MTENEIAAEVVDCAIHVHREMGPGLLESVYEACLFTELSERGLNVERQVVVPVIYKGQTIEEAFRADIIVESKFLIELKACSALTDVHLAQTLTYLKLLNFNLGLLLNFNVALLKHGIRRVINSKTTPH